MLDILKIIKPIIEKYKLKNNDKLPEIIADSIYSVITSREYIVYINQVLTEKKEKLYK